MFSSPFDPGCFTVLINQAESRFEKIEASVKRLEEIIIKNDDDKKDLIEFHTSPYGSGKTELNRFKNGETLTLEESVKAMCYDCHGHNAEDCGINYCPMYSYMPFR